MLVGYRFENYTSFYDETSFNMIANRTDKIYLDENTFSTKYGNILKSVFVFGANGSGKSNCIDALEYMRTIVLSDLDKQNKIIGLPNHFYFNNFAVDKPLLLEITFIIKDILYEYGFEILKGEVNKEYLYKKSKRKTMIFNRTSPEGESIELSSEMENVRQFKKNLRVDTLFLNWANFANNELAMTIYKWFEMINIYDANNTRQLLTSTVDYIENTKDGKEKVLQFMRRFGTNIISFDLNVEEDDKAEKLLSTAFKKSFLEKIKDRPVSRNVEVTTKHINYNSEWKEDGVVSTDMVFESAGTRKLFEIAGPILDSLDKGNIVVIDEIDSKLHPKLVHTLVMLFNSSITNPNNAQLICNTHDVMILEQSIRRDQIYFVEKNQYGVSRLFSLTSVKGLRKTSNILKQYLAGEFGAIYIEKNGGVKN